jgi:hypothetical protein
MFTPRGRGWEVAKTAIAGIATVYPTRARVGSNIIDSKIGEIPEITKEFTPHARGWEGGWNTGGLRKPVFPTRARVGIIIFGDFPFFDNICESWHSGILVFLAVG